MVSILVGIDDRETCAAVCTYLEERVGPGDTVHGVCSVRSGYETDTGRDGAREVLDTFEERLGDGPSVETHLRETGEGAVEVLLSMAEEFDVDELVIGIRRRSPVGKVVFGSTSQKLLLRSPRPVVVVPLTP